MPSPFLSRALTSASTTSHCRMLTAVCSEAKAASNGVPDAALALPAAASWNQSPSAACCRCAAVDSCGKGGGRGAAEGKH